MNQFPTRHACLPFFVLGALILVIVAISPRLASAEADKCTKPGKQLAAFDIASPPTAMTETVFFDAEDKPVSIADFKGRGVVLNFWATWCVPCVKEMPALSRLKDMISNDGIDVLTLSIDRGGARVVARFLNRLKIENLDILIDKKNAVLRKNGIVGLPTTLLIDPDGIIRGRVQGIVEWDHRQVVSFLKRCIGPDRR